MQGLSPIIEKVFARDNFYIIGNLCSMASFIISIWVLLTVRTIKNAYRFRARAPSLIKELSKASTNINKFLNAYSDSLSQIREEFTRAAVKLRSLRRNVTRSHRQSIKRVVGYIDQCEVNVQNEDEVRLVYIELFKVIEELKDYQKDLEWEV
jgi:hypothetical protein